MSVEKDLEAGDFVHEKSTDTTKFFAPKAESLDFNYQAGGKGSDEGPSRNPRVGTNPGTGEGDILSIGLHAAYS